MEIDFVCFFEFFLVKKFNAGNGQIRCVFKNFKG